MTLDNEAPGEPDVTLDHLELRDASVDDAEAVAGVHVASWRSAYEHLLPRSVLDGLSVTGRARWWSRVLAAPRGDHVLVARMDGVLCGFVHVSLGPLDDPDTGELVTLYVIADAWGTGVGRQLHDAGLNRLADQGCETAGVWMLSTNERARRFYERNGWTLCPTVRIQSFGSATVVDHRFHRTLTPGGAEG